MLTSYLKPPILLLRSLSLSLSFFLSPEPSIMVLAAQTVQMMIHAPSPLWKYHYQYFTIFHKINLHVHGTLKGQYCSTRNVWQEFRYCRWFANQFSQFYNARFFFNITSINLKSPFFLGLY